MLSQCPFSDRLCPGLLNKLSYSEEGNALINLKLGLITFPILSSDEDSVFDPTKGGKFFDVAKAVIAKKKQKTKPKTGGAKKSWMKAMKLIKDRGDPWEKFHLEDMKSEKGRRHR